MIPNSSQSYLRRNTVAKSQQGDTAYKNELFILYSKIIPIDDPV